ncbi:hypothetical protein GCM10028818_24060 [Spirosoma horti]
MKQLLPFFVVILFLVLVAVFILALLKYRLKKRIIESGNLDEISLKVLAQLASSEDEALKWGLILLTSGLGLIVLEFVPFSADGSPLPYGLEMVFTASGFLLYHVLIKNRSQPPV